MKLMNASPNIENHEQQEKGYDLLVVEVHSYGAGSYKAAMPKAIPEDPGFQPL